MNEAALGPEADDTSAAAAGNAIAPEVSVGAAPEHAKKGAPHRFGAESTREHDQARAEPSATGTALVRWPLEKPRRRLPPFRMSHGLVAAAVAVLMGSGYVAGTAFVAGRPSSAEAAVVLPPADTQMDVLYRVQGEVRSLKASLEGMRSAAEASRQEDSLRGLRRSVDQLKQDLEGVKAASTGAVGQLSAKIERLDRDPTPKLAEISARLDKLDHGPVDQAGRHLVADRTHRAASLVQRARGFHRDPGSLARSPYGCGSEPRAPGGLGRFDDFGSLVQIGPSQDRDRQG